MIQEHYFYFFIIFLIRSTFALPKKSLARFFIVCLTINFESVMQFKICSSALLSSSVSVKTSKVWAFLLFQEQGNGRLQH